MTLKRLLKIKPVKGKPIKPPTSSLYNKLAEESDKEIEKILRNYAKAKQQAAHIWVR